MIVRDQLKLKVTKGDANSPQKVVKLAFFQVIEQWNKVKIRYNEAKREILLIKTHLMDLET